MDTRQAYALLILVASIVVIYSAHSYFVLPSQGRMTVWQDNSWIECGNGSISKLEIYGTNDVINNCTFSDAVIDMHGSGKVSLYGPSGTFRFGTLGKNSSVEVWYYLTFVPHDINGQVDTSFPNIINVHPLEYHSLMDFRPSFSEERVFPGIYTLPVEVSLVTRDGTVDYNPYVFSSPDWGHDILSIYVLNVTRNMVLQPDFVAPQNVTHFGIYPATFNAIQFLVMPFDRNPVNATLLNGVQFSHPKQVANYMITGNTMITYELPNDSLGFFSYLMVLEGANETDNSTTVSFSRGITYCTPDTVPVTGLGSIVMPGYYPFAFESPRVLLTENYTITTFSSSHTFNNNITPFLSNDTRCSYGVQIMSSNVTVDCRGGFINSTLFSFSVSGAENVTIENCNIYGSNGIVATNSEVTLRNVSIYAHPAAVSSNSVIKFFNAT